MPWYAVYTKSRNEKKVAEGLLKEGIEAYTPLVKQKKKWADRKKTIETPLMPSYVFVKIEEKDRHKVFDVPGIVRFVYWLKQPVVIREDEMEALKASLKDPVYQFSVEELNPGMPYEITEGPLTGQSGVITHISNTKLQIMIISLNMKVTIERKDPEA